MEITQYQNPHRVYRSHFESLLRLGQWSQAIEVGKRAGVCVHARLREKYMHALRQELKSWGIGITGHILPNKIEIFRRTDAGHILPMNQNHCLACGADKAISLKMECCEGVTFLKNFRPEMH